MQGILEDTELFYGIYSPVFYNTNNSVNGSQNFIPLDKNLYDLPLAYLLATIVYFILSLVLMVN